MLKGYREYKKTEILWLQKMPSHWHSQRAKTMYTKMNRSVDKNDDVVTCFRDGVVTLRKNRRTTGFTESVKEIGYQGIKKGDLVIHVMDAFAGAIGVSDSNGKGTPVYTVCMAKGNYNNYYYAFVVREMAKSGFIQSLYRGIRERSSDFRYEVFGKQLLPIPSRSEQDQIVRYLDWKISMINKYINAKKKQIELLKEQKQTIVNEMVTSGGKNWEKIPLRKFLRPVAERNRADLPLLSVVREQGVILRDIDNYEDNHNFIPDDLSNYKVVYAGQFVMNKMKAWQGSYGVSAYDGIVSPAYYVFNLVCDCVDFFHIAIRSRYYINKFAQHSIGIRIGQWDLPIDRIKEISFLLPPLTEQHSVVEYINKQCAFINKLIKVLNSEIVLFTEYRTRLISDVVTGKVDVQGEKVPEFAVENENSPGIRQETEGDIDDE